MRHARRLGAAAVASSVSLLATFGVAEAIRVAEDRPATSAAGAPVNARRNSAGESGPSRLLVIRRAVPTGASSGGTIYVQAPPTTTAAPVAQAPTTPTTQSS